MTSPAQRKLSHIEEKAKKQLEPLGQEWIPTTSRLFGAPPIIKYEAFSSWLARVAAACKTPANELLKIFKITGYSSSMVDAGKCQLDLMQISKVTMVDPSTLTHINWAFDSILADRKFYCLTYEMENQNPIYRYCPACLRSDEIPHFRQSWRLASAYICPIHKLILRDSCHSCNHRIDIRKCSHKSSDIEHQKNITIYCTNCLTSLGDSDSEEIDRKFLSEVFYRQEEIENLIRSTSSYWMPSELSINHEILSNQDPRHLVWSVTNAQIFLKMLINKLGNSDTRAETRKSSALKIEHYLHKMDLEASKFSFELNGVYAGLNSQNIFSCLAPYIGLQVSKYQSIMGSTIWYSDTPSKIEEQLSPLYNASQHEERPMRRANI